MSCPSGKWALPMHRNECRVYCGAGRYTTHRDTPGSCTACPAGSFTANRGSDEDGEGVDEGATHCNLCPFMATINDLRCKPTLNVDGGSHTRGATEKQKSRCQPDGRRAGEIPMPRVRLNARAGDGGAAAPGLRVGGLGFSSARRSLGLGLG